MSAVPPILQSRGGTSCFTGPAIRLTATKIFTLRVAETRPSVAEPSGWDQQRPHPEETSLSTVPLRFTISPLTGFIPRLP